jgi:DNA-binding NarL/FixJ family response regulator
VQVRQIVTAREGEILQLLMRRLSNKDISSLLAISERTVKFHVSNILSKLQVSDRRGLSPDKLALKTFASETSSLLTLRTGDEKTPVHKSGGN